MSWSCARREHMLRVERPAYAEATPDRGHKDWEAGNGERKRDSESAIKTADSE
jgi:hypothetical protein